MIQNLLYETKVTGVTKLLKAHVNIRNFSMGYCKNEQRKYIVSQKTSTDQDVQYNVNERIYYCIIFMFFFLIFINYC